MEFSVQQLGPPITFSTLDSGGFLREKIQQFLFKIHWNLGGHDLFEGYVMNFITSIVHASLPIRVSLGNI